MPAYDFRCTKCGKEFEVTRSMGSGGPVACPDCGAETKKVFSPVGVAFKGTGFHNTDYRPRPKDESAAPEAPACPAKSDVTGAADSAGACATCPAKS